LFTFLKSQKPFGGFDMNHPIAKILDEMLSKADPEYKNSPDIKWNFTKFLIDKKGMVKARFEPTDSMEEVAKQIEAIL
jgi:glutathione peroxidase